MFRCEVTKRISREGDKCNKIVIQTRPKTYRNWDKEKEEYFETMGTEIVKEINATDAGVEQWKNWSSEEKQRFLVTSGYVKV